MTTSQLIISAFALLIGALMLPLPSGVRSALFLLLVGLAVLTLFGGGIEFIRGLFG